MRTALLALSLVGLAGCVSVPDRYRAPLRVYEPRVESVSVDGFERTEFFPTTLGGAAFIAPQLGIYAAGSGVKGEYRTVSDASMTRWFLEDTRCVRRVREATEETLRIEGQAGSENHVGLIGAVTWVVIVFSLTAVIGVPYTSYADGWAVARIYRDDEFVASTRSDVRLHYTRSAYNEETNKQKALALARAMALRDVADRTAAQLCGSESLGGGAQ